MQPPTQINTLNNPTIVTTDVPAFGLLVLAVMLTIAVYTELKESRIPNWLTLSGMAAGLLIGYLHGNMFFMSSLGGLAIGFGFMFIFYLFNGVGGGDVKLMGAVGALMGVDLVKPALFYTTFIGAFLAVMIVIWRRDFWLRIGQGVRQMAFWRKEKKEQMVKLSPVTVPYGIAIATGCLLALFTKGTARLYL
jgi:prepilin peptidase CpaA